MFKIDNKDTGATSRNITLTILLVYCWLWIGKYLVGSWLHDCFFRKALVFSCDEVSKSPRIVWNICYIQWFLCLICLKYITVFCRSPDLHFIFFIFFLTNPSTSPFYKTFDEFLWSIKILGKRLVYQTLLWQVKSAFEFDWNLILKCSLMRKRNWIFQVF